LPVNNELAMMAIDNSKSDSRAQSGQVTANFIMGSRTDVLA
jgi:hypothetical protein